MSNSHTKDLDGSRKERVCVVGAGMSGLVAMKELLAKGNWGSGFIFFHFFRYKSLQLVWNLFLKTR